MYISGNKVIFLTYLKEPASFLLEDHTCLDLYDDRVYMFRSLNESWVELMWEN